MNEEQKKQIPLRISQSLWQELSSWADDEFRSINGQIEYLLTQCVKRRNKSSIKQEESKKQEESGK